MSSPHATRRLAALAALAALFLPSTLLAGDPWGGCGSACYQRPRYTYCKGCLNKDRPPHVHGEVPFGYYPTQWMAWPGQGTSKPANQEPPVAPNEPEVLPPPHPADPEKDKDITMRSGAPLILAPAGK